jgi:DNA-binding transcriptional LysR family regulator
MTTLSELDWNLVRTFVTVAERGSLSGAARSLGLAHPTVARHVQQLERALGIRLFERTASGLSINEAGLRLAHVGRRMQRDAAAFEAISESVRTTSSGRVRITLAELLADLIADLLVPLRDFSGTVERQFEVIVSADQLNLLEREADLAVRHARPEQSELIARRVGGLPMAAFASEAYVAEHGMPELATVAQHWFVDGASEQRFAMAVERLGHPVPQNRVVFRTDSLHTQRRAAVAGWGVAALPTYLGDRTPDLVRVFPDAADPVEMEIWLVARPGARQQALLREVAEQLGDGLERHFREPDRPAA